MKKFIKNIEELVTKFEYGDRESLTRDELIALVAYLMNSRKQMHSECLKALEVIKGVPCKGYTVSNIAGKSNSKTLTFYYEVSNYFIKNELEKYDFHALTREELE